MVFTKIQLLLPRCTDKLLIIFFTGHCAKLWAIMKNSKVNKKASGKKWLVVVDDDSILRSVGRSVCPSIQFGVSFQSVAQCVCLSVSVRSVGLPVCLSVCLSVRPPRKLQ